ncbi:hypothetical protein [Streptomyces rubellomurinus]|uniref:Uncharacterized protein n=2 Tax=Streptomyces TaxID=1883 RepID=A0A0F2T5Y3_STRR3|nr:hypothetical protein [Streptomyces rubellomurinus]KJS57836.1 hypothetical protein VM95_37185 [Streptomyces rubellomurinus]
MSNAARLLKVSAVAAALFLGAAPAALTAAAGAQTAAAHVTASSIGWDVTPAGPGLSGGPRAESIGWD